MKRAIDWCLLTIADQLAWYRDPRRHTETGTSWRTTVNRSKGGEGKIGSGKARGRPWEDEKCGTIPAGVDCNVFVSFSMNNVGWSLYASVDGSKKIWHKKDILSKRQNIKVFFIATCRDQSNNARVTKKSNKWSSLNYEKCNQIEMPRLFIEVLVNISIVQRTLLNRTLIQV